MGTHPRQATGRGQNGVSGLFPGRVSVFGRRVAFAESATHDGRGTLLRHHLPRGWYTAHPHVLLEKDGNSRPGGVVKVKTRRVNIERA